MTKLILKHHYKDADPLGIFPICNYGGLVILAMEHDHVIAGWNLGDGNKHIRRHGIFHTYTGRAYINKGGRRYYFDQIMRTNGGF